MLQILNLRVRILTLRIEEGLFMLGSLYFWIAVAAFGFCLLVFLTATLVCFFKIFYSPNRMHVEYPIPSGAIYNVHREAMIAWIDEARMRPHTAVSIRSFDGLTLRGNYYEYEKGAPIEILFHGYRGSALRDMSGGIARCFAIGHSALVVDHRASGESDGHVISFGINESRDCAAWVDFVIREIDRHAQIVLTGISMGAATVMIASAMELPPNVVGVLADCGYTSARAIIKQEMRKMHLPADLMYPFAKLAARVFGHFDLDETSPLKAVQSARVPIIFFHGDTDDYVPYEMSAENFAACVSEKRLVKIEGAGHGLCFPVGKETYVSALRAFFDPITEGKRETSL